LIENERRRRQNCRRRLGSQQAQRARRASEGGIERSTQEQAAKISREADAKLVGDVAKKHGVSDQPAYAWRKRFGTRLRT
jgi:hypothetical protein